MRNHSPLLLSAARLVGAAAMLVVGLAAQGSGPSDARLLRRAVLPAATFASGPTSGQQLTGPINGVPVPFVNQQPVQGFSAIHDLKDGTFLAMSDNGFGSMENSADYLLRVYRIRPNFEGAAGGPGTVDVLSHIQLRDPNHQIDFAITNHFSPQRRLTGADFDIESMMVAADGSLWFGDEFGPFLLHTDANGVVLEAPIPLPDFDNPGQQLRSPQNPYSEEASAVRVMNAMRAHARRNGNQRELVFSPWHVMLDDQNPATVVDNRSNPPTGSGLSTASSEVFNVASVKAAGHPVVVYTVNDTARMTALMQLRVNGIISDRPDLLYQAVAAFDANNDTIPGDWLLPDGRIDITKFDAQGHRGGRNLRPENTLPAIEVALDNLMTTLEFDCGVTLDQIAVLDHDPLIQSEKARRADGQPYGPAQEVLVRDLTLAQIQQTYIADKLIRDPEQTTRPLAGRRRVRHADQPAAPVRDAEPAAGLRLRGLLRRVLPDRRRCQPPAGGRARAQREPGPLQRRDQDQPAPAVRGAHLRPGSASCRRSPVASPANGLAARADVQSFDFRTLLAVQEAFPAIRTVCLFGTSRSTPTRPSRQ
jgi:glycerophosphoryl diester phosphodiesterase